jgi:hypothetical protein
MDASIKDYNESIAIRQGMPNAASALSRIRISRSYLARARILAQTGQFEKARSDCGEVIASGADINIVHEAKLLLSQLP